MTTFGVTAQGFVQKTLQDILDEIEQEQRSVMGPAINQQADSVLGQVNGIFADKIAEAWEVALAIYRARQPDSASDEALDNVGAITGAVRLPSAPSTRIALVSLDAGATLLSGAVASIGTTGARWLTQSDVTNPEAYQATVAVVLASEDSAPVVGNAYAIDTIAVPSAGWSSQAARDTLNAETFPLVDGQTLLVVIDEGAVQTVVFLTGDFVDIAVATALEVADVITDALTGAEAVDAGGRVRMTSDTDGAGSALQVAGGTASEALGFIREKVRGFNPDVAAKILGASGEPYALADDETLFVKVDRGTTQVLTFKDDQFALAAFGQLVAIGASLLVVGADTDTFVLDDGTNPAVTFAFDDDGSVSETATLRAVNHTGTETADAMEALIIAAIIAAPTLDITPTDGGAGLVDLANDAVGTTGNVAIVETVANPGFTVSGMAGGAATTIATATAVQVARAINDLITGAAAYSVAGAVQLESFVAGSNSFLEVTGGSANGELDFLVSTEQGGVSGDATLGRDVESDAAYRLRREELLRISGAGTLESLRAAVREITDPDVTQAFVFENTSDVTDAFGRPPHSFEVVVVGGDDAEIASVIFLTKPLGIQTFRVPTANGRTEIVVDSQGTSHTIEFSRADPVVHHIEIDIDVDAGVFGGGDQIAGEQQVREALKAVGDLLQIGEDVIILRFACAALDVAGLQDVTVTRIEDTDPPTNTSNIVIDDRELATFSISDIDVNTTFV